MRRLSVAGVGLAALLSLSWAPSWVQAEQYTAELTGEEEVPPVDTSASGSANIVFVDGHSRWFLLTVRRVRGLTGPATGAHIHLGPVGVNGPVVVDYSTGVLLDTGFLAINLHTDEDLAGPLEGMTLQDLKDVIDEGNGYINVHTELNPGGEIRGQIVRPATIAQDRGRR
jgi:prepilin-type processing-associated H-X9-DG protein